MGARTVACSRCGALIQVLQLTPHVTCAHCGNQQVLAQHPNLQQYQQRVASDVQAAGDHRAIAAQHTDARRSPNSTAVVGIGLMGCMPTVVAVVGGLLVSRGVLPAEYRGSVNSATMVAWVLGAVLMVIGYAIKKRTPAKKISAGATSIACPNCGADHAYLRGQAIGACNFCSAALMPTPAVVQAGLEQARVVRRSAEMEQWRAERNTYVSYAGNAPNSDVMGFVIFGMFPPLGFATAIGLSWQMLTGVEPYHSGVFAAWGLSVVSTVGLIYWVRYVRGRTRVLKQASEALAAQFQGRPIGPLRELVRWLNHYWAAKYDVGLLQAPGTYGGAYGTFGGYNVAAECSATVQKSSHKRVQLFVAAFIPGISDGAPVPQQLPPAAEQHRQWLSAKGFRADITTGGVHLIAEFATVKHIDRDLSRFGQLAPIVHHGCELARALGAIPAPAIP